MSEATVFEVEQAGCESCAALVRDALEVLVSVAEITIDEQADLATVRLASGATVSEDDANRVLREASPGTGHAYRVKPGSWRLVA
ncbi:MAG TPA: heavy-metal-associated domain-containing protein [Gaiellaceae bacterium]|nr:heavy-metal-associated domain-containing protein [Gaiellaceae bacterium]